MKTAFQTAYIGLRCPVFERDFSIHIIHKLPADCHSPSLIAYDLPHQKHHLECQKIAQRPCVFVVQDEYFTPLPRTFAEIADLNKPWKNTRTGTCGLQVAVEIFSNSGISAR
jgi:hypothetical protein